MSVLFFFFPESDNFDMCDSTTNDCVKCYS